MALPLAAVLAVLLARQATAQNVPPVEAIPTAQPRVSAEELKAKLGREFAKGADVSTLDFTGQPAALMLLLEQAKYVQAGREPGDLQETHVAFVRSVARRLYVPINPAIERYGARVRQTRSRGAEQNELDARAAIAEDVRRNRGMSNEKKARVGRNLAETSEYLRSGLKDRPTDVYVSVVAAMPADVPLRTTARATDWKQLPPQVQPLRLIIEPTPSPTPEAAAESTFPQRVSNGFWATSAYVARGIDAAEVHVTGSARVVQNSFYNGIEMIRGFGYRLIRAGKQSNWGIKPLVDGLRKIAAYMRSSGRADTDIAIGDLSSADGGQLAGHASHRSGRDADIGFYMTDEYGNPMDTQGFVKFTKGPGGLTGLYGRRKVHFDAKRNWFLIQAILANDDPAFKPSNIFIDNQLEAAILAAAGDHPDRARANSLMSYWVGHTNHLHLRVK